MTVTLEFPPDTEAGLRERAAKHGQSVTDYLLMLIELDRHMAETAAHLKRKKAAAKPFARG